jgi:glutamate formiminotransferase
VLECVVNVSEGRRLDAIADVRRAIGRDVLDVHSDADHHRSVFTMVGTAAPRALARLTTERFDLRDHEGVHPRIGIVDVVPFVPLDGATMTDALAARDDFAAWAADELGIPSFFYGPERDLPEIRKRAFADLAPDVGPRAPHPTAGAICAGARDVLVAYNVWLDGATLADARRIARELRTGDVRTLGLPCGAHQQVSMNLIAPARVGPEAVYDAVAARARVARAELVGLLPARILAAVPKARWAELDLGADRTIEWRLAERNRAAPGTENGERAD